MKTLLAFCGGCGINILYKIKKNIDMLGFSDNVSMITIDTTESTKNCYNDVLSDVKLLRIASVLETDTKLNGSGGERKNTKITASVDRYIKQMFDTIGDVDCVIAVGSASGGTGGVIIQNMVSVCINKGIAIMSILVMDASTLLYCHNTLNTIGNLNKIAEAKKPFGTFLLSNTLFSQTGTTTTTKEIALVDRSVMEIITILLTMFYNTYDIDAQDMLNLAIPSNYKTFEFKIENKLYRFEIAKNDIIENQLISRVLLPSHNVQYSVRDGLLNIKTGVINEKAKTLFDDNSFPIILSLTTNLDSVVMNFKNAYAALKNRQTTNNLNLSDELNEFI